MIVNLALLRSNIGKPGANICAVRGHSNVQGQRTVGITEKPGLAPLDKLSQLYGFESPRWTGHNTIDACEAILSRETRAFVALGGNCLRAVPETEAMEAAWRKLRLTVSIATKLNRSHVVHGDWRMATAFTCFKPPSHPPSSNMITEAPDFPRALSHDFSGEKRRGKSAKSFQEPRAIFFTSRGEGPRVAIRAIRANYMGQYGRSNFNGRRR